MIIRDTGIVTHGNAWDSDFSVLHLFVKLVNMEYATQGHVRILSTASGNECLSVFILQGSREIMSQTSFLVFLSFQTGGIALCSF